MRGDFSSFWNKEDKRNFNGVLHQQGRVLLDRDWNAQTEIFNDWQETAAQDIIGAGVAAVPADAVESFKVTKAEIKNAPDGIEITVNEGRVWADGLLIELSDEDILKKDVVREATYLKPPIQSDDLPKNVRDAVILEAWHEELNAFQKPELLIEPALGGVDTTERFQTAYRLRLFRMDADDTCDSIIKQLEDKFENKGKLTAVLKDDTKTDDDCPVTKVGGYTGFEHQLYRIEIAQTDRNEKWFKWSQFNGGLIGRGAFDNQKLKIEANLNAILHSDLTNFYLETLEEKETLGKKENYWQVTFGAKVTLNTADNTFTLPNAADVFLKTVAEMNGKSVFFRLWNDIREITTAEIDLQDGIKLQFETNGEYTAHDFWTFSVRAGEIKNDTPLIDNKPPQGIFYHRVPLAELDWTGNTVEIEDCRLIFQPLTKLKGCCTYRVGDGINSHGDFTKIKDAIMALPKNGGEICILPGDYPEKIELSDATRNRNIIIKGCGKRTRIIGEKNEPVILVAGGINVKIESLTILTHEDDKNNDQSVGILLKGDEIVANEEKRKKIFGKLRNVKLENLRIVAGQKSAIEMHVGQNVSIRGCQIFVRDVETEWQSAVYLAGDDILFEENEIRVMSGSDKKTQDGKIDKKMQFDKPDDPQNYSPANQATGGLHLAGGCARVRVVNNLIIGGTGNGITLGSIDVKKIKVIEKHIKWQGKTKRGKADCDHQPGVIVVNEVEEGTRLIAGDNLRDILIERNRIFSMGLNGIGVDGFFSLETPKTNIRSQQKGKIQFITVENLVVIGNRIEFCLNRIATQLPAATTKYVGYGGIALADVENLVVRDNFIRDNGTNFLEPTCGIFILHGRGIEISRNYILNNGRRGNIQSNDKPKPGARGGIFIVAAAEGRMQIGQETFVAASRPNGVPALKLHENIVAVPSGRALTLRSTGNVSITDNQFLTQSIAQDDNSLSLNAASVLIFSLNTAGNSAPSGFLLGREGNIRGNMEKLAATLFKDFGKRFLSGSIQFADNQCELLGQIARGKLAALSAILILSLDDVGFLGNQTNCVMNSNSRMVADTIVFGANVRASDNSWRETPNSVSFSAITFSAMLNTTTDNHSTHCLIVLGKLFLDRFNLTQREAEALSGNNDIVEIFKTHEGKLPCRPNRRILVNYGTPIKKNANNFVTTPILKKSDG